MNVLHRKAVKIRIPEFLVMLMAGINGCLSVFNKKPSVVKLGERKRYDCRMPGHAIFQKLKRIRLCSKN